MMMDCLMTRGLRVALSSYPNPQVSPNESEGRKGNNKSFPGEGLPLFESSLLHRLLPHQPK